MASIVIYIDCIQNCTYTLVLVFVTRCEYFTLVIVRLQRTNVLKLYTGGKETIYIVYRLQCAIVMQQDGKLYSQYKQPPTTAALGTVIKTAVLKKYSAAVLGRRRYWGVDCIQIYIVYCVTVCQQPIVTQETPTLEITLM